MASETTPPFKSSINDIKLPPEGFKSSLPEHLLNDCDEQTKWLMREVSKNSQMTEFAIHAILEQNNHLKALNGRTYKMEKGLAETKETVVALDDKATLMEPLFKPISLVMRMWDYRWFRWGTYIVGFFLLTYVLPWYVKSPPSIEVLLKYFFG